MLNPKKLLTESSKVFDLFDDMERTSLVLACEFETYGLSHSLMLSRST